MAANALVHTALGAAEHGVNHLLALDPAAMKRIAALDGKRIALKCSRPDLVFIIILTTSGVLLIPGKTQTEQQDADTTITGSMAELMSLLTVTDKPAYLRSSAIEITGDIELSTQLQELLEHLDIDWESKLATWLGDIPAHIVGNQLRSVLNWGRQSGQQFNRHLEEYLHEEARVLPPASEIEAFYQEVDDLVINADRLAARLERIRTSLPSGQPKPNEGE